MQNTSDCVRGTPQPDQSLMVKQPETNRLHGSVILRDNTIDNVNITTLASNLPVPPDSQYVFLDPAVGGYPRPGHTQMSMPLAHPVLR